MLCPVAVYIAVQHVLNGSHVTELRRYEPAEVVPEENHSCRRMRNVNRFCPKIALQLQARESVPDVADVHGKV
jgi:hypothetical protein